MAVCLGLGRKEMTQGNMVVQKQMAPVEQIEQMIFLVRSQKVMVDADLAALYGVPTKVSNQAVTRNKRRFPPDFMFRLTKAERHELVTNCDRLQRLKHSSAFPRAFTEQGGGNVGKWGQGNRVKSALGSC
ncbi:MAG: ORF6N domain-containing protein [Thermodesulfobacteriota bacterium]|nr:ORF6N domain-containing protein [Thermodesulfobacteriota bacterium]